MTRPRCRWCGCFVATNTTPTTRTVQGFSDGILAWRTFTQILCPSCSESWSTDHSWNRASTENEIRNSEVLSPAELPA